MQVEENKVELLKRGEIPKANVMGIYFPVRLHYTLFYWLRFLNPLLD